MQLLHSALSFVFSTIIAHFTFLLISSLFPDTPAFKPSSPGLCSRPVPLHLLSLERLHPFLLSHNGMIPLCLCVCYCHDVGDADFNLNLSMNLHNKSESLKISGTISSLPTTFLLTLHVLLKGYFLKAFTVPQLHLSKEIV